MAAKCKIFEAVIEHFMGINISIDTPVCTISKVTSLNEEKEICLPNRGYISGHRLQKINVVVKCIAHMHTTAELKAYWLHVIIKLSSG